MINIKIKIYLNKKLLFIEHTKTLKPIQIVVN